MRGPSRKHCILTPKDSQLGPESLAQGVELVPGLNGSVEKSVPFRDGQLGRRLPQFFLPK